MRLIGWLASLLGVLGILFGNGLASVVWIVKLNIQARVRDLVAVPDGGLDIATTLTRSVAGGLTQMAGQIGEVQAAANRLAAAPAGDDAAAVELASAIDTFVAGPYSNFRALYQRLRERALSVGDALSRLGRSTPMIAVPQAAVERLQAIDERMIQVDAAVSYLSQLGVAGLGEPGVATQVAQRAATAQETLASVSELVAGIEGWIGEARVRLAAQERRFFRWLNIGTVVASVAGLLFAGLNVLLFQQGRRWSDRR